MFSLICSPIHQAFPCHKSKDQDTRSVTSQGRDKPCYRAISYQMATDSELTSSRWRRCELRSVFEINECTCSFMRSLQRLLKNCVKVTFSIFESVIEERRIIRIKKEHILKRSGIKYRFVGTLRWCKGICSKRENISYLKFCSCVFPKKI